MIDPIHYGCGAYEKNVREALHYKYIDVIIPVKVL